MEQNLPETKRNILSILRLRGPCLPAQISREIRLEMLLASALLSELASEKTIKISSLKIGGSPLYFLAGQEQRLEKFCDYLQEKEKQAFALLKQKKILIDNKQEPAIRVALRNIKDFAFPFVMKSSQGQMLFWRFHSFAEHEARSKLIKTPKKEIEKPLLELKAIRKQPQTKKTKEKSDFVKSIISKIGAGGIEITEEKTSKKREYEAIVKINSDIGKISFFLIAKDKKKVTDNDLTLALQKAQTLKLPALLLSPGELNKKAQAYLEQYSGLVKFMKL